MMSLAGGDQWVTIIQPFVRFEALQDTTTRKTLFGDIWNHVTPPRFAKTKKHMIVLREGWRSQTRLPEMHAYNFQI